jgi:hypothetical protein
MPATPKLARLRVTFHRDGREIDFEEAATGERALRVGLVMLARLDDLQAGDACAWPTASTARRFRLLASNTDEGAAISRLRHHPVARSSAGGYWLLPQLKE